MFVSEGGDIFMPFHIHQIKTAFVILSKLMLWACSWVSHHTNDGAILLPWRDIYLKGVSKQPTLISWVKEKKAMTNPHLLCQAIFVYIRTFARLNAVMSLKNINLPLKYYIRLNFTDISSCHSLQQQLSCTSRGRIQLWKCHVKRGF